MMQRRRVSLGQVCDVIDSLHKTPRYSESGFPMVRVTDIKGGYLKLDNTLKVNEDVFNEFSKKHKPKEGDIVMSRVGSYGVTSLVKEDFSNFCLGQNTVFIIPKENPYFIYYCLNSPHTRAQIEQLATGSTQKTISLKSIKEIEIFLPDLTTQTAIAEILSSLDDKIELNTQINQNLEALAQAIFKHWFVNFEFPNENGQPYKSSGGEMVESELGEIPKDWATGKISQFLRTTSGGTPSRSKPEYYQDGNISWVKSKELNNSIIFETEELINDLALENSSAKLLPRHSILIAMYGATVGQFAMTTEPCACNQAICAIIPNDEIPYSFIYFFIQEYRKKLLNLAVGSAQQNISQELIKGIKLIMPSRPTLKLFHSFVAPFFDAIETNSRENQTLTTLRNTILPRLMSDGLMINIADETYNKT